MSHQVGLTVSGQVVPERLEELLRVVDTMAEDPGDNPVIPFGQLPYTHFGRVVVLAAGSGGTDTAAVLMTLDCDAKPGDRLRDLVDLAAKGLDELFGACVDYPDNAHGPFPPRLPAQPPPEVAGVLRALGGSHPVPGA